MINIEKTAAEITKAIRNFMAAEEYAYINGYMQGVAAEIKMVATFILIFLAVMSKQFIFPLSLLFLSIILAFTSRISPRAYLSRFYIIPLFSLIIVLPLAFVNTDATIHGISISRDGSIYVMLFTLRVMAAVACISLLLFTTRFSFILSALRRMRIPSTLISVMAIVYRYLFTFLTHLNDMLVGRRSRMVEGRRSIKGATQFAGNFMSRILFKSDAVYMAMKARGFNGVIKTFSRKFEWNAASIAYMGIVATMVFLWVMTEL